MTKFLENLLRDGILALFYIANIFFHLGGLYDSKMPLVNFLLDTRYHDFVYERAHEITTIQTQTHSEVL